MPTFYEFFAGGGMVRQGLGPDWHCVFANDFDAKKGLSYQANWGTGGELLVSDIRKVETSDLAGRADMCWGSFPCQDLSLAGWGKGLAGERSGTFHVFWSLIERLKAEKRAPRMVAVENVCGALSSRGGEDFIRICQSFADAGYRFGALVINADQFVPQSRPRLFVIGVAEDLVIPEELVSPEPIAPFHNAPLRRAASKLPDAVREQMVWWNLPIPPRRAQDFVDLIEDRPKGVEWHSAEETRALLAKMSDVNRAKVTAAKRAGRRMVGGIYKRTRRLPDGTKVQRAEVRFDDVAGCLRTPSGGSSRQIIMVVDGRRIRTRLISPRETARLMGLPDTYRLPKNYNDAYHLTGDGVVAPVVEHLGRYLFEALLEASGQQVEKIPDAMERRVKGIR
ncbi:DNA cytosine methyltransferase [Brevundimonas pishanensis]|uniref:DNA cytosine methyltransferase n=1 Tax=Brevundimonas pishanensis TaxID=2896315 RepID=UPI001FA80734|nr:DNA cytosine methyltransferase [Brevundimonas pishanensis]